MADHIDIPRSRARNENKRNKHNKRNHKRSKKQQKFDLPWFYSRESLDAVLAKRKSARSWLIDRSKRHARYKNDIVDEAKDISDVAFYNIPKTGMPMHISNNIS